MDVLLVSRAISSYRPEGPPNRRSLCRVDSSPPTPQSITPPPVHHRITQPRTHRFSILPQSPPSPLPPPPNPPHPPKPLPHLSPHQKTTRSRPIPPKEPYTYPLPPSDTPSIPVPTPKPTDGVNEGSAVVERTLLGKEVSAEARGEIGGDWER